ncbi:TPA: response regulator [Photobacterium damselae]
MNVLIVDDDSIRAEKIKHFLIEHNDAFDVHIVNCTDDAKKTLRTCKYDLLLLDVVLPKRSSNTDKANFNNGLNLLSEITRRRVLKKPTNIIGITAHLDDISKFKVEFEKTTNTVIEITNSCSAWRNILSAKLDYILEEKIGSQHEKNKVVITIHGIRTFGEWQNRFKHIILENSSDVIIEQYSYSYFSLFSFLIPYIRNIEVKRFYNSLEKLSIKYPNTDFYLFSHSFGTYITVKAIDKIIKNEINLNIKKIILAGSVLKSDFDWTNIAQNSKAIIINDCGVNDYILWLSNAFVPNMGMAGRIGFHGFKNDKLINRSFNFSHSEYFSDNTFLNKYWLPLLSDSDIKMSNHNNSSLLINEFLEPIVKILGLIKSPIIVFFILFILYKVIV